MKYTLTTSQAIEHLRPTFSSSFSYDGASRLINYLEELEESTGEEIELDPIALRCQFVEYKSYKEAYLDRFTGEEITEEQAKNYFDENTLTLPFEGGVIIDCNF